MHIQSGREEICAIPAGEANNAGANGATVACITWLAQAKQQCIEFESHCSHIGLPFFPSCISCIIKIARHFYPLGDFRSLPLYAEYDAYTLGGKYIQETLLLQIH